nr:SRPBCC family protein [Haloactinomyces albus]
MQHHFTVPVPVEVAWPALLDPEGVAPCMPGATLNRVEDNEFGGSVKVKLGSVSLLYKGSGTFTEIDADAHRVVIDASGKDSRGNGTAAATVTAVLSPEGGSTSVTVDTDLKVTGKPAQFGRGLISEVGGKILGQFADCLAERLAEREQVAEEVGEAEETADVSSAEQPWPAEPTSVEQAMTYGQGNGDRGAPESVTAGEFTTERDGKVTVSTGQQAASTPSASSAPEEEPARRADAVVTGRSMPSEEAIDLLDTAGGPILKRLAPVGAVLAVLAAVFLLRRRRRQRR